MLALGLGVGGVAPAAGGLALARSGGGSAGSAASAAGGLRVVPFPGTPDAFAGSQVIFSTLSPSELRWVRVVGSRSGLHAGHLELLPGGAGTAFAPDRPFLAGELVRVSAGLSSPAAGTAAGDPGATRIAFSFRVAVPASGVTAVSAGGPQAAAAGPRGRVAGAPVKNFHSAPTLHPPIVHMTAEGDPRAGDIFLTTNNMPQVGAMILNGKGQLVWYLPEQHGDPPYNFRVQHYQGKPVLTYWQGNVQHGHGINGEDVILNSSYQVVKVLHAGNGYSSDLHEFQLTGQGTALIDAYVPVKANLSSVGGPSNGTVLDCVVQRIDISTGQVLWEWHMLGHVPLSYSHLHPNGSAPYDAYHLNSIQQLPGHRLLISARNTWGVYLIGPKGNIVWELGGMHTSFRMGQYTNFEWQHDARLYGNVLSVFDDGALPQEEPHSVAKEISLNTHTMTATMIHSIGHSPPLLAGSLGNVQRLPDHNLFVGWGSADSFSEYTLGGKQIFNGSLPLGVNSYRAFRFRWTGHPTGPPSMAAAAGAKGSLQVYASWNGATQVASWQLLGGLGPQYLSEIKQVPDTSFETTITLPSSPAYLEVRALNSAGQVLGTSPVQRAP